MLNSSSSFEISFLIVEREKIDFAANTYSKKFFFINFSKTYLKKILLKIIKPFLAGTLRRV